MDLLVGASMRRRRLAAGWEPVRFASATGVLVTELIAIEAGQRRLGATELFRALHALGVTVKDFYEDLAHGSFRDSPKAPDQRLR